MKENKLEQIGAFWINTTRSGDEYLSGTVNGQKVTVFLNKNRKEQKHPYWIVYVDKKVETPK